MNMDKEEELTILSLTLYFTQSLIICDQNYIDTLLLDINLISNRLFYHLEGYLTI